MKNVRCLSALGELSPGVVSKGMGGVKIVEDYGAGLSFEKENPYDLADKLSMLAQDYELYVKCATNAVSAAKFCSPEYKAQELVQQIKERFPFWMI